MNVVADIFSRFCHFPNKETTSKECYDDSEAEYVMGLLDEFDLPHDKYKITYL